MTLWFQLSLPVLVERSIGTECPLDFIDWTAICFEKASRMFQDSWTYICAIKSQWRWFAMAFSAETSLVLALLIFPHLTIPGFTMLPTPSGLMVSFRSVFFSPWQTEKDIFGTTEICVLSLMPASRQVWGNRRWWRVCSSPYKTPPPLEYEAKELPHGLWLCSVWRSHLNCAIICAKPFRVFNLQTTDLWSWWILC